MGSRGAASRRRALVGAVSGPGRGPRAVALAVLSQVRRRHAYAPGVLDAALAKATLNSEPLASVTSKVITASSEPETS